MYKEGRTRYVALYERLSRDDEQQGESNSIINQKAYLEEYFHRKLSAECGGYKHFTDDGYSGVNFERPGFNEMLDEVRAGRIYAVVVKDLSRLGRNYLQVGYFTEILFPDHDVRFIAVNNSVDTASDEDNELTPFINIMNEWYAKDTSKKVKAILRNKMQAGIRINSIAPYGYYMNTGDTSYSVDPEAAKNVRYIFELAREGLSPTKIAQRLHDEEILIPAAYSQKFRPSNSRNEKFSDPYGWRAITVSRILNREEYLGHSFLGRTEKESFKSKKTRKIPREEQQVFMNTHEPLVDQDLWTVARRVANNRRFYSPEELYSPAGVLAGSCFCADCRARMIYHNALYTKRPDGKRYPADDYFMCSTYVQMYSTSGSTEKCTAHYIRSCVVERAVMRAVKRMRAITLENETFFLQTIRSMSALEKDKKSRENRKERERMNQREKDLGILIRKLYEDRNSGRVSDRLYEKLMKDYEEEQIELERRQRVLALEAEQIREERKSGEKFVGLMRRTKNCDQIDELPINDMIDKIMVYSGRGFRERRTQRIDIYFSYIGYVDVGKLEEAVTTGAAYFIPQPQTEEPAADSDTKSTQREDNAEEEGSAKRSANTVDQDEAALRKTLAELAL